MADNLIGSSKGGITRGNSLGGALMDFLLNPWFRWISFIVLTTLTILGYLQEPIRFSDEPSGLGLNYKWQYFVIQILNMSIASIAFLGLWYTIPFTKSFPYLWYIPIIIIGYAYITQLTVDSPVVKEDNQTFNPPPSYMWSKWNRGLIFWGILIFDIICFVQGFIYSGVSPQFKNTVLHQFILNRFGGTDPSNLASFTYSWLGVAAVCLDIYMLYNQTTFRACDYKLPASWNF
jgi:hypothetical protein